MRGDLSGALSAFATRHLLDFREPLLIKSDYATNGFGVTLWLMGDARGASFVWSRSCGEAYKGRYTHSGSGTFQSGLLLWFASVWLKDQGLRGDADRLFDKLLRKKTPVMGAQFPSQLARLVRGETDLAHVAREYSDAPLLRERQEMQAVFYAGVRECDAGHRQQAERLWQRIGIPKNPRIEFEYHLLVYERGRFGASG